MEWARTCFLNCNAFGSNSCTRCMGLGRFRLSGFLLLSSPAGILWRGAGSLGFLLKSAGEGRRDGRARQVRRYEGLECVGR